MDRYAVLGNPVKHSRSPRIHQLFAQQLGIDMEYRSIHVELGSFTDTVRHFFLAGGRGVNITVPFKQEAFQLAEVHSQRALRAEAVNTLLLGKNNLYYGDNTDGVGLLRDLKRLSFPLQGRRILLLGAGGAARGVLAPLLEAGPAEVTVVNRDAGRAALLAHAFSDLGKVRSAAYGDLSGSYPVIINATSASLSGELPPLPEHILTQGGYAYDMMYGAQPTIFMHWALQAGAAEVHDGLGMLVEQAAEAFFLWRHQRPDTAPVLAQLRAELVV